MNVLAVGKPAKSERLENGLESKAGMLKSGNKCTKKPNGTFIVNNCNISGTRIQNAGQKFVFSRRLNRIENSKIILKFFKKVSTKAAREQNTGDLPAEKLYVIAEEGN
jgi:hypothetical protein